MKEQGQTMHKTEHSQNSQLLGPSIPGSLEEILPRIPLPRKFTGPAPWYQWIKGEKKKGKNNRSRIS